MTGRERLWIAGASLAAFAVGALAGLPARFALGFAPEPLRSGLERVEGTIWRGGARHPAAGGPVELRWALAPTSLLVGAPRLTLEVEHPLGTYRGDVVLRGRRVELDAGTLRTTLSPLARFAGLPPGALLGGVELRQVAATIDADGVGTLACEGDATGLSVAGVDGMLALGDLALACVDDAAGPRIELADRGGPLAVEARIALAPGWRYLVAGTASARPGAPQALVDALPLLGTAEDDGRVRFRYAGELRR